MSLDPTSIISLIKYCKKVYDYFSDVKHSSAERRRLLEEVRSLQSELEALHRLANTSGVYDDQASMERLAQVLDPSQHFVEVVSETLVRVEDVLSHGTSDPDAHKLKAKAKKAVAAMRWTGDKVEVKDLLSDLERYKSRIALALQHDMFKKQVVADGKLDIIQKHLSDKDRLEIAKFISENDFTGHQKGLLEQRLKNTGTWMIRHPDFVAWRDDKESRRTLWCYGHPGAGKSVMAALIVDHLQSLGNIVLSMFCRYSSDNFTTPFPVLRGLLRQLIERSTTVPSNIHERYLKQIHPTPDDLPRFLAEAAAAHAPRPIYIVIDALDECNIALALLREIQQLDPSFRVLVTSRPVFNEIQKHASVKIRASDEDVLVAVETTLSRLDYAWLDEKLKRMIRAQVVKKADGMFLLASLQLRELECDVTCRHDVADILDSLPDTLDAAYEQTFRRICGQRKRSYILACRALALITLHSQFLKIEHLQHLLAEGDTAQYPEIETVLQCCHGLVHMGSPTKLAFIHYSVHEYIKMHWPELFQEHPNRINMCLKLGFSTLRSLPPNNLNMMSWEALVSSMGEPEEPSQVIPFFFTPEARASFIEFYAELPHFQRSLLEERVPGMGTWVLQHPMFVAWRDDRESPRTVSCETYRKCVLAALVVDHLQSRGDTVLSIFCGHSLNTFTTTAAVLCSLLRQLIEKSLNQSQPHPNPGTLPVVLAHLAASHEQPIYIVIDAVDECSFGSDLLHVLQDLDSSFRILITLKPKMIYDHLMTEMKFLDFPFRSHWVIKEIHEHSMAKAMTKIYAADRDILTAVDTALQKLKHAWLDEELKSTIRARVVLRANGLLDLASLLLHEMKFNFANRCDVVATLDSLPRTLDDAYKLTFQRIRGQGKQKNTLACRTLAIAASSISLDFAIVQHLLAEGDRTQYTNIKTIVLCCHGLLHSRNSKFIYDSAQEYTIAHWSELFPENPNPGNLCLQLALSTMTNKMSRLSHNSCKDVVDQMTRQKIPEKLKQVISFLSTPATRELLVEYRTELTDFVHDPFLIACYFGLEYLIGYIIETAPQDMQAVQRFNETLCLLKSHNCSSGLRYCIASINMRRDMGVNIDGVVVGLDSIESNTDGREKAKYRLEIAKFISGSDFTHGHQRGLLQEKLNNTGTWLMQDPKFIAWRDDRESLRMLWCYGHPGTGKSVMAASIVDHLQARGDIILSVFCRHSSNTFKTSYSVLCDLLGQLIGKSLKVLPAIYILYERKMHPYSNMLPKFLAEIAASHAQPIYIVVDALDECRIALELLNAIQQLGYSFRILVTSRPVFKEIEEHTSIEIRASDDDILIAVETTLTRLDYAWLNEALKSTIRLQVVEKADGLFRLASLQLRELERVITHPRDILDILASLPHTLDDTYKLTFQRIRKQGERKTELACRTLAFLALHSPVLETKHVQHLLAEGDVARYLDIETITECCHGLVQKGSNSELPVFINHSVHEYTTRHWSELFPEHPKRINFCLQLGISTLRSLSHNNLDFMSWEALVSSIEPEELSQVIPFLFTSEARESFIKLYAEYLHLQRSLLEGRVLGTGTWVLQHPMFVAWRDDRESSRTVWYHGNVDSEKYDITALVVDHLQSRGDTAFSIFCGHSSNTFTTTSAVLCGLLRQLIEKSPNQSQTHLDPDTLPVSLARLAASHERPIYIIIDAIDDCPLGSDLLCALQHLDSSFRIFVTPPPDFEETREHSTTKIYAEDEGILTAINTTLQELEHVSLDDELESTIRVRVLLRANGLSDFASLLLRDLKHSVTSRRDVVATLDSLPRTLDEAYKLMFQRIRKQDQWVNELACCTLAIVALRALNFTTVQHLLAEGDKTQYTDIKTILECCHGLLANGSQGFRFIAYSAEEYTIAHWSELFPENPNPVNLCLQLALSTMTNKMSSLCDISWYDIIREMTQNIKRPEKLKQVISFLSTRAAKELLVEYRTELAHFVHDPFLIACYFGHRHVIRYMIETAPRDVQHFNEALRLLKSHGRSVGVRYCTYYINEQREMRVNSDGVVVTVDPDEGKKN